MKRRREPSLGRCGAAENQGASPSRSKGWTAATGAPATPLSRAARVAPLSTWHGRSKREGS